MRDEEAHENRDAFGSTSAMYILLNNDISEIF
jgi:hypothetical protein